MSQVYYADYNADTTGALPAGWELNDSNFLPVISTSNVFEGAKCVQLIKNVAASTGLHYFALDTSQDPGTGDYEVEVVVYFDGDDTTRAGIAFRGLDAGTNQCYAAMLRGGNSLRLSHITGNNETTVISTVTVAYDAGIFYHIKVSANGSALKVKFWADGEAEPGTWDIEVTNSALDNTNHYVGAYFFNGSADADDVFFDALEVNDFNIGTDVTVNAGVLSLTASLPAPTVAVIQNVNVAAGVQTISATLPAITIVAQRIVTITPNALNITASLAAPTVATVRNANISAGVQTIATTLAAPSISAVRNVSVTPEVQIVTSALPAPTVSAVRNVTVSQSVQATTATIQPPTVSTGGGVTVSPGAQSVAVSLPTPSITASRNVSVVANVQMLAASVQAPEVEATRNVSIAASVLTIGVSQLTPTITAERYASIDAEAQQMTLSVVPPTVLAEQNVSIEAGPFVLVMEVPEVIVVIEEANPGIISLKRTHLTQRGSGLRLRQNGGYTKLSQRVSETVLK